MAAATHFALDLCTLMQPGRGVGGCCQKNRKTPGKSNVLTKFLWCPVVCFGWALWPMWIVLCRDLSWVARVDTRKWLLLL